MTHKTESEILAIINDAKSKVSIGDKYCHYKNSDHPYEIVDIVVIEASEQAGIVYSMNGIIKWLRPIDDFLAEVEIDGRTTKRFIKIS